jgi:hypothetical protein
MFPWSGFGQGIGLLLSSFCGGCAGLEAEAVVSSFEDVAVVGEAIDQSRRHLGVAEHPGPFAAGALEWEVRTPDAQSLPAAFRSRFARLKPAINQPMT